MAAPLLPAHGEVDALPSSSASSSLSHSHSSPSSLLSSVTSMTRLQLANFVLWCGALMMNGISNLPSKPFGGKTNADISNAYKTAFTPAGYAFSIWGLIFSLGVGFIFLQALPSRREWTRKLGLAFGVNSVGNGFWLVAFANEWGGIWVSVAVIFSLILLPLVYLYLKLDVGVREASPFAGLLSLVRGGGGGGGVTTSTITTSPKRRNITWQELVFAHTFVSVYMGWVTVACVANVSIALTPKNAGATPPPLGGISPSAWSIAMQITAATLALLALLTRLDAAYAGPIAWALIAISKQQSSVDWPGNGDVVACAQTLGWTLVGLCAAAALWRVWLWKGARATQFAKEVEPLGGGGGVGEVAGQKL
jgi:hypothetical protein